MKEEFVQADASGTRLAVFNRSISWSAVTAGLVVAMVSQILLTMIGVAIGAATIQPTQESNPANGLGTGAAIWWIVTALLSLFIGARVAGKASGVTTRREGGVHGFLMWCTSTVFLFMIAGTMLGGVFGTGAMMGAGALTNPNAQQKIKSSLNQVEGRTPGNDYSSNPTTQGTAPTTVGQTDQYGSDNTNVNRTENNNNPPLINSPQEAQARETGEKAARTTTKGALWTLLALIIGALVCYWSGSMAVPKDFTPPTERDRRVPGGAVPTHPVSG
jgi:hypothetical protein